MRLGQAVARPRSSELVEAQRLFLEAATAHDLAQEKLRRDEQLSQERVIAERRLIVTRAEATGPPPRWMSAPQLFACWG